jgi:hypothetical protein
MMASLLLAASLLAISLIRTHGFSSIAVNINTRHHVSTRPPIHPSVDAHHPLFARPKRTPSTINPPLITSTLQIPSSKITERMIQLTSNPNIAILVDAENVRGKTNFELSHSDLLDRLLVWSFLRNHAYGRTIVVIDHGSKPTAHLISRSPYDCASTMLNDTTTIGSSSNNGPLCINFAGPILKADDIIARDTRWLLNQPDVAQVTVVTNDRELSFRCRHHVNLADGTSKEKRKLKKKTRKARRMEVKTFNEQQIVGSSDDDYSLEDDNDNNATIANNKTMRVNVISSTRFLEDVDQAMQEWLNEKEAKLPEGLRVTAGRATDGAASTNDSIGTTNAPSDRKWQILYELRSKILYLESCLRKKCTVRKRQQLTQEMRRCKEQWEAGLSSLISDSDDDESLTELTKMSLSSSLPLNTMTSESNNPLNDIETEEKKQMLLRWGERRGSPKREATEDRVILAEMLRSQLKAVNYRKRVGSEEEQRPLLVELYADYINSLIKP